MITNEDIICSRFAGKFLKWHHLCYVLSWPFSRESCDLIQGEPAFYSVIRLCDLSQRVKEWGRKYVWMFLPASCQEHLNWRSCATGTFSLRDTEEQKWQTVFLKPAEGYYCLHRVCGKDTVWVSVSVITVNLLSGSAHREPNIKTGGWNLMQKYFPAAAFFIYFFFVALQVNKTKNSLPGFIITELKGNDNWIMISFISYYYSIMLPSSLWIETKYVFYALRLKINFCRITNDFNSNQKQRIWAQHIVSPQADSVVLITCKINQCSCLEDVCPCCSYYSGTGSTCTVT